MWVVAHNARRTGRGGSVRLASRHKKIPRACARGIVYLKSGGVLLSHGETPHYHRRWYVSLLGSEWSQVVPYRYGRQT